MKTLWKLSENDWEYYGDIYITSKEMPIITDTDGHKLNVDGVIIEFDEEIKYVAIDNTTEVVEVVRCKDCSVPHNMWTGCPKLNGLIPPPNFFCSFGERGKKNDIRS